MELFKLNLNSEFYHELLMLGYFFILLLDYISSGISQFKMRPIYHLLIFYFLYQLTRLGVVFESTEVLVFFKKLNLFMHLMCWYATCIILFAFKYGYSLLTKRQSALLIGTIPALLIFGVSLLKPSLLGQAQVFDTATNPIMVLKESSTLFHFVTSLYHLMAAGLLVLLIEDVPTQKNSMAYWTLILFTATHLITELTVDQVDYPALLMAFRIFKIMTIYLLLNFYNGKRTVSEIFFRPLDYFDRIISEASAIRLMLIFSIVVGSAQFIIEALSNYYHRGSLVVDINDHDVYGTLLVSVLLVAVVKRMDNKLRKQLHTETALNKQLNLAMEKEAEAYHVKSMFLANISHEIRTPMNGVVGMARLLAHAKDESERSKYGRSLIGSSEQLMVIINDILDFSKLEAGKLDIVLENITLEEIVEPIIAMHIDQAEQKGLQTEFLCELPMSYPIRTDVVRLQQILNNVFSNAVKFTSKGKITVKVDALVDGDKHWLRTTVSDTGIGIPKEKIPTLFEKFSQADSSITKTYGGTGLGLSIVHQLVQLLHGSITVQSEEGRGSTFTIVLPDVKVEPLCCEDGPCDEQGQPIAVERLAKLRVLVAEDNPINQLIIAKTLENLGISPTLVVNGAEALQKVIESPFDLVLMDLQMPVMDGITASEKILGLDSIFSPPQIVALTADTNPVDRKRCEDIGMMDIIIKPFKEEEIQDLLMRIVIAQEQETISR